MVTDIRGYSHLRRLVLPRDPADVLDFATHRHVHETAASAGVSYHEAHKTLLRKGISIDDAATMDERQLTRMLKRERRIGYFLGSVSYTFSTLALGALLVVGAAQNVKAVLPYAPKVREAAGTLHGDYDPVA